MGNRSGVVTAKIPTSPPSSPSPNVAPRFPRIPIPGCCQLLPCCIPVQPMAIGDWVRCPRSRVHLAWEHRRQSWCMREGVMSWRPCGPGSRRRGPWPPRGGRPRSCTWSRPRPGHPERTPGSSPAPSQPSFQPRKAEGELRRELTASCSFQLVSSWPHPTCGTTCVLLRC